MKKLRKNELSMNIHEYANELIQKYYENNKGQSLTFHLILFLRKCIEYKYNITVYYLQDHI